MRLNLVGEMAGLERAKAKGMRLGRPGLSDERKVKDTRLEGDGIEYG
jgi:hypothetical protein